MQQLSLENFLSIRLIKLQRIDIHHHVQIFSDKKKDALILFSIYKTIQYRSPKKIKVWHEFVRTKRSKEYMLELPRQ